MDKKNTISKHIGILCAMPEEIGSTLDNLKNIETKTYGDLKIYSGDWCFSNASSKSLNIHLSIAWSGWGKVSAARAATRLIGHQFNELKIEAIRSHGRVWKYKGTAKVDGKRMADAEWSATIVDRKK